MATPTVTPTTPRRLVVVTGGSGYIAGYCVAHLSAMAGAFARDHQNVRRTEEVRATIGKIAPNAGAIEFVAADLNSDGGWANAVAGADHVLHVAIVLSQQWTPRLTMNWFNQRTKELCACSRPSAMRA